MFYIKGVTLDSKPALNPLPTLNETGKGNTTNLTITLNSNITNGNGPAPFTAEFKGNASGGSAPYLFSWNFGDGGNNTAIGQIVSHAFTTASRWPPTSARASLRTGRGPGFAEAYADRAEADWAALDAAVRDDRLPATFWT